VRPAGQSASGGTTPAGVTDKLKYGKLAQLYANNVFWCGAAWHCTELVALPAPHGAGLILFTLSSSLGPSPAKHRKLWRARDRPDGPYALAELPRGHVCARPPPGERGCGRGVLLKGIQRLDGERLVDEAEEDERGDKENAVDDLAIENEEGEADGDGEEEHEAGEKCL